MWHLEPSLTDPDTVYAGVEDAALFRTTDGGMNWSELAGLRTHGSGASWQPGAGGMCLHTIVQHPSNPQRIFIAISAAGAFRTDDGGVNWETHQPRPQVGSSPQSECGGRALRASPRVLNALESRYPTLCGTIRDYQTQCRRPFVRFFACEQDPRGILAVRAQERQQSQRSPASPGGYCIRSNACAAEKPRNRSRKG